MKASWTWCGVERRQESTQDPVNDRIKRKVSEIFTTNAHGCWRKLDNYLGKEKKSMRERKKKKKKQRKNIKRPDGLQRSYLLERER